MKFLSGFGFGVFDAYSQLVASLDDEKSKSPELQHIGFAFRIAAKRASRKRLVVFQQRRARCRLHLDGVALSNEHTHVSGRSGRKNNIIVLGRAEPVVAFLQPVQTYQGQPPILGREASDPALMPSLSLRLNLRRRWRGLGRRRW